jgi:hypothetical protein
VSDPIILRRTGLNLFFPMAGACALAMIEGAVFTLIVAKGGLIGQVIAFGLFLPFIVSCLVYTWMAWKSVVTLSVDRIVKFNGFWSRSIMRSEIRGVRLNSNGMLLRIVSNKGRAISLLVKLLKSNEAAIAWLDEHDDLDALDFQASLDRLSQDERLGSTPEKRVARIMWLQRVSGPLYWITFAVLLWATIWPRPFLWAWGTMASIPIVVVVLDVLSGGGVRYDYRFGPKDARPNLVFLFFFPGVGLPGIVFREWNILDYQELLAHAAVLGAVAAFLLAIRSESLRRHLWPAVLCAAMLFGYAAGLLGGIDVLFDKATPARFPVNVLGVRSEDHFDYVNVGPWGPYHSASEVRVLGHLVHTLPSGARVCIYLGSGRLGFRWYRLGDC